MAGLHALELSMPMPFTPEDYFRAMRANSHRTRDARPDILTPISYNSPSKTESQRSVLVTPVSALPEWAQKCLPWVVGEMTTELAFPRWTTVLQFTEPSSWASCECVQYTEITTPGQFPHWKIESEDPDAEHVHVDVQRDFLGQGPPLRTLPEVGPPLCVIHRRIELRGGDRLAKLIPRWLRGTIRTVVSFEAHKELAVNLGRWVLRSTVQGVPAGVVGESMSSMWTVIADSLFGPSEGSPTEEDASSFLTPPSTPTEVQQLQHTIISLRAELASTKQQLQELQQGAQAEAHDWGRDLQQSLSLMATSVPGELPQTVGLDGTLWLVLTVGTPMDKVKSQGKVNRAVLRLSSDLTQIEWQTIGKIYNSRKRSYDLAELKALLTGCRYGRSKLSAQQVELSFSLVFPDRYLDLIAPNKSSFDIWVCGLQVLLGIQAKQVGVVEPEKAPKPGPMPLQDTRKHKRAQSCHQLQ